jgi:fumarate hydratase subunit beta
MVRKDQGMRGPIRLQTPLRDDVVKDLKIGDRLFISGVLYSARDAAHTRMVALLDQGGTLPFDIRGQVIYYVGPTPPRPGSVIGAAGPTTSYRMDAFSPRLMKQGLKGMIGKGMRSREVIEAMQRYRCIYMAAVGGAGALLSKRIKKAEIVAYEDLGPEAIRRLEVEDFPVVLINDIRGNDLYGEGIKRHGR